MSNIVFVVQLLSQPRCIKRIETIKNSGISVKVYGYNKGLYTDNIKKSSFEATILVRDKNASRFSKLVLFVRTVKNILANNSKDDIFYFFGFELCSIAYFLGCRRYIYEEADISANNFNSSFVRKLFFIIDRQVIRHSLLTVHTSKGFAPCIFKKNTPNNIIYLPNKLNSYFDKTIKDMVCTKHLDTSNIKFGFIGLIRFPNTIIRFAKVIGRFFPQHEYHFYGDLEQESYIDEELLSFKNVYFHGPFTNPSDLLSIYSKVDFNVVCYDTSSGGALVAEANKLYESVFFETPIIVTENTVMAERVQEMGSGYAINPLDDEEIVSFINSISNSSYEKCLSNMKRIPYTDLVDDESVLIVLLNNYLK